MVKSKPWWWAPTLTVCSIFFSLNPHSQPLNNDGVLWKSPILDPLPFYRLHRVTLYSFCPIRWYSIHSRVLVPDSELPHELLPSPLDLKAPLGVGIIPMWHLACPTLWQDDHDVWNMQRAWEEQGVLWEGKEVIVHKLFALSCIYFQCNRVYFDTLGLVLLC